MDRKIAHNVIVGQSPTRRTPPKRRKSEKGIRVWRVVTFEMVDRLHKRPEGTARRNFTRARFIED